MRPSEGAEASAVVWSVWLRLAVTTPEATRSPRALLAVLRRAVDSLPTRSGMLQTLVAEWMATTLPASTVRELTPAIIALPATPLATYEALLAAVTATHAAPPSTAGTGATLTPSTAAEERRQVRLLFETAAREYGAEAVRLWLSYSRWYTLRGEVAEASAVHARALKNLKPELHQDFVEAATTSTSGI